MADSSQHGDPPSTPTKQELMQRLGPLKGFATAKRKSLLQKFPTSEALLGASVDDIATVKSISQKKASEIRQVLHGEIVLDNKFAGKERVVLWNTTTERKVAGAAAPTVDKADAWLAKHPHYQRYTGQDREQKSELHVPDHCKLSEAAYAAYCEQPTGDEQQLETTLSGYKLRRGSTVAQAASSASTAVDEVCAVIARSAAMQFGQDRAELQTLLGEELYIAAAPRPRVSAVIELDDDEPAVPAPLGTASILTPLAVLKVANRVLRRPVWVFTSLAHEKSVLEVGDEVDPQRVVPLRLAQLGNSFFPASVEAEADIEDVEAEPALSGDDLLTGDGEDVGGVQLPDIKEDLATSLKSVVALCSDVEEWSKTRVHASLDLSTHRKPIVDYQERLRAGDGLDAGLIGDNGVGKSTLVNLSILNTLSDESTYAAALESAPEAVRELLSGKKEESPSLRTLLGNLSLCGRSDVSVQRLSDYAAVAADGDVEMDAAGAARRKFDELESSIRKYAEVEGQARPKVSDVLLPCGIAFDSTTALHTRVRGGGTIHGLVENATVEELQQDAYQFVQLRRDLGDDDPDDLEKEKQKELKRAWHTYIRVKDGTVKQNDLPNFADDAWPDDLDELEQSWSDIEVCEALLEVVKSRYVLYLGGGTDLHLDRKHLHDLLWRLNDKDQLHRFAAKSVEVFVPAAVLEGGCSFVDLPGLGDVDGLCLAQTIEGLQRSGVVFVVLKKSLAVDNTTFEVLEESGLLKRIVQNNDIDVVFITNREMDQGLRVEHINSEEEARNRLELESATKKLWKKRLTNVNKKMLKAGESSRTEDEIEQIVQNTQCRSIYPMTHTAFKLNVEHAEAHKEQAEAIFSTSNVYWLLGLLEALNRDGYVRELEHIVTVALPELRAKLQSSLTDVAALNAGSVTLPKPLVKLAETWLKPRSRDSAYGLVLDKLVKKVDTLTTGTESYRAQLGKMVCDFMEQDETVQHFLEKAETNQPASCRDLLARIHKKSYGSALKAIDPRYKGSFPSLEIMPVAFGSKNNQVSIDFQPLIDELEVKLEEIKEVVIAQIVSSVDEAMSDARIDTDMSVSILRESFATSDILSTMNQRFRNFFSARQHAVTLKNGQPAEYFKKQAVQCRVKALNAKVLSQHRHTMDAQGVQGVCARIESNLRATRDEWKRLVTSELEEFVYNQFAMLYNDLVGPKGLLKSLLRGFLQHVVQTSRMQGDDELQQHLRRFLRELQQHTNRAHAMWTRLIKRDDPEQLGRAAAQHVERRRLRQMIERRANSGSKLLGEIPAQRMPPLELLATDKPCKFTLDDIFAAGDLDQVSTLNKQVLVKYKRGRCKVGQNNLFSAFAMVVWGKRVIKEQFGEGEHGKQLKWRDGLTILAKQLRALCICQLRHYSRKPERYDQLFTVLHEPVEQYIARLESGDDRGDYNGDALCLWQLAAHFRQNFVLWLPGLPTPIFFPGLPDVKTAHHLVIAASEKPTTNNPAASFSPSWFHFEDDRKIKFDPSAPEEAYVGTTDEECEARLTADAEPVYRLGLTNSRVERHRHGEEMGALRPHPQLRQGAKRPKSPPPAEASIADAQKAQKKADDLAAELAADE